MNTPTRAYSMATRTAKAAETKARIHSAAVALHAERMWDGFTLEEVARRAGTTVQTILRVYGSKETLSVIAMQAAPDRPRPVTPPGDIAAAIGMLYADYADIGDRVIQYLADEPRHPALSPKIEAGRQAHRWWVKTVFAPQLATRSGQARERMLVAFICAADVYLWKLLVRDLKLSDREAQRIAVEMIAAISQGFGNGKDSVGVLGRRRQSDAEPGRGPRARKSRA